MPHTPEAAKVAVTACCVAAWSFMGGLALLFLLAGLLSHIKWRTTLSRWRARPATRKAEGEEEYRVFFLGPEESSFQQQRTMSWFMHMSIYASVIFGVLARVAYFVEDPEVHANHSRGRNSAYFFLTCMPNIFFFAVYILLIFLWADVISLSSQTPHGKRGWITTVVVRLVLVFTLFAVDVALGVIYSVIPDQYEHAPADTICYQLTLIFHAVLCFLLIALLCYYGFMIYRRLHFALLVQSGHRVLAKIAIICAICTISFTVHGCATILSTFYEPFDTATILTSALYFLLECLPSTSVLFLLRHYEGPQRPVKKDDWSDWSETVPVETTPLNSDEDAALAFALGDEDE